MKSRAEYQKRRAVSRWKMYSIWFSEMSTEERQSYLDMGYTLESFVNRCSRELRHLDRKYQYIKKHGVIVNGKRIRKGELSE